MSRELTDVVVSRDVLESTGYESLEHVAECAEKPLDRAFVKLVRSGEGFRFAGTPVEHDLLWRGAHNLSTAYWHGSPPAAFDCEGVFRALCFGRNFVTQMRRYRPALYERDTPLHFDDTVDSGVLSRVYEYADGRALLTRYANSAAVEDNIPSRQYALYGVARVAMLYTFMQAEQQAYDVFIDHQQTIFSDQIEHWSQHGQ